MKLDGFLHYVLARQQATDRRAAGEPRPWSDDPVVAGKFFCSVIRDDDRTSREAREIILGLSGESKGRRFEPRN